MRRTSPARRSAVAALAVGALVVTSACGSGDPRASDVCDDEVSEAVDPQSVVHVLPGAPSPDYGTDLPTSGVHVMDPRVPTISDEPLEPAVAVGVLERSGVVIEYGEGTAEADRGRLEGLATDDEGTVVVAPLAPGGPLDRSTTVVARAWRTALRCDAVDVDRLEAFVSDHLGTGSAMASSPPP